MIGNGFHTKLRLQNLAVGGSIRLGDGMNVQCGGHLRLAPILLGRGLDGVGFRLPILWIHIGLNGALGLFLLHFSR